MNQPRLLTPYTVEKVALILSVTEVGEMNHQEVNKLSGEAWEGCWLG